MSNNLTHFGRKLHALIEHVEMSRLKLRRQGHGEAAAGRLALAVTCRAWGMSPADVLHLIRLDEGRGDATQQAGADSRPTVTTEPDSNRIERT